MNPILRIFQRQPGLIKLLATSVCLLASVLAQQTTDRASEAQAGIQTTSSTDFEVKIDRGEFLARRKGTVAWKRSREISESIVVGHLDGDQKIYIATKALKPPKAIHMGSPDYPTSDRESGNQGQVSLHVVVDDHGEVRNPVVDVSPGPQFAKAAIEAIKKWTFQPAKLDGQPVATLVIVTMQFNFGRP